ncbi:MAG: DNA primase [Melioribacteraceae bacterium]|nr:MAG: DNA primase [Melioribacteraceae bacterium]
MRIPESKIEEILNASDIVDVVSAYVQLKKRGKNFFGICPFHQEKTPSFAVNDEKQIYHCFGCGNGGNVFKFLMEYKSISFVEAVQEMAEQLGIKIEYDQNISAKAQNEQEAYYDINLKAAKYFSDNLLKGLAGEYARDYLTGRKLTEKTMRIFGLGFALPGWDNFLKFAKENQIDLQNATTLGLIDKKDNGDYYDKYRNRIMFPIFSTNGRIIAFGGRILDDSENAAKYLNSPESIVYHKKRSLYGLFHAKEEIRKLDRVILVEGYMDVIALFQGGVKNVVASSGTSLTEEQVQLISRFSKNVVLLFDADAAGMKASLRSIELLLKQDFEVKIATLPKGEDPDSFINKFGKDEFEKQINNAQNFLEYQTAQFKEAGLFDDPSKHAEAIREMVKSAALVIDELKRNLLIKSIAKKFGLREKLIETELNKYLDLQNRQQKKIEVRQESKSTSPELTKTKENRQERDLIKLLFSGNPNVMEKIINFILPDEFINPIYKRLAEIIYDCYDHGIKSPASIIEKIEDDNLRQFTLAFAISEESISKKWDNANFNISISSNMDRYVDDLLRKYKLQKIDDQIKATNKRIAETSDESDVIELMKEIKELQAEKKILITETQINNE